MWNIKKLEPPPFSTTKILNTSANLSAIRSVINETITLFSEQLHLKAEANMLYKFLAYRKISYRRQCSWKAVQKLNHALRIYQETKFGNDLYRFYDGVPVNYRGDNYFPTRNMLDYILVRAQGVGKLLCRIFECAEQVYTDGVITMHRGHNMVGAILTVAISARIIILIRYILQNLCKFYQEVLPWRYHLGNTKMEWLQSDYEFPMNLRNWLDADWAFVNIDFNKIPEPQKLFAIENADEVFDVEDDDVEFIKQYFDLTFEPPIIPLDVKDELLELNQQTQEILDLTVPQTSKSELQTPKSELQTHNSSVITLDEEEEIGIPIDTDVKFKEIWKELQKYNKYKAIANFVEKSPYFKELHPDKYSELLLFLELTRETMVSYGTLNTRDSINRLKKDIMMKAFNFRFDAKPIHKSKMKINKFHSKPKHRINKNENNKFFN